MPQVVIPNVNTTVSQLQAPMVAMMVPVNHTKRPEKFTRLHFKIWQQKMLFYFTTLNLTRFLTKKAPELEEGEQDA